MVVISKLLHPLFKRLRYQVLHFPRSSAWPCRLDREGWVLGATQLKVGKCSSNDHCKKKEKSDGTFAYRESRKVDSLLGVRFFLEIRFLSLETAHWIAAFASATRTRCPSLRRCAPRATISSPGCSPFATVASSLSVRSTFTDRKETVDVALLSTQTPGPWPRSVIEARGTCMESELADSGIWIVTVAPRGAFAASPPRTYRASKVRVDGSAASESCLSRAVTLSVSPYKVARTTEPRVGRIVSGR